MEIQDKPRFLDRTWGQLRHVWHKVTGNGHVQSSVHFQADLPNEDLPRLRAQIQLCLKMRGGEVSARAETAILGRSYLELNDEGRSRFLKVLATDFDVDTAQVEHAIECWHQSKDVPDRYANVQQLRQALEAPRLQLLTQFNELPEGVKFLVDMRAELITLKNDDPAFAALEGDLKRLLISWFDIGFLTLDCITWDSPASLLEKLITYESVHEIRSWDDLKNRLDSDRRCYAFLHPHMLGEPLIFVEVALTIGLARNVQDLLDENAPVNDLEHMDTAIFYSISNAQQGLAGISFGNFLIKRVVAKLSEEFPHINNFATLSPIVSFRRWLTEQLANDKSDLLTKSEQKSLTLQCERLGVDSSLRNLLETPNWPKDSQICEVLQPLLTRLAAHYLSEEKRSNGRAFDPVAHFHLTNGAHIEQLNWMGDKSEKGLRQSYGLMVNYLYRLDRIESNSAAYVEHAEATTSNAVKALLKN
ncbi:MAG: malonyl-CoA decarboxylase [Colwellia sp.]|nr:MAG: malonyl-CoA decarboxylase [Colwellia sp.]